MSPSSELPISALSQKKVSIMPWNEHPHCGKRDLFYYLGIQKRKQEMGYTTDIVSELMACTGSIFQIILLLVLLKGLLGPNKLR